MPSPSPNVPYVRTVIHFEPSMLDQYLQQSRAMILTRPFEALRNCRTSLSPSQKKQVEILLANMNEIHRSKSEYDIERLVLRLSDLLFMFAGLCQNKVRKGQLRTDKENYVQKIITYLEEHYMHEMDMDQIAQEIHLSKHYLGILFKEMTGTTIYCRINQAKLLLWIEPQQSVTKVSKQSGFKH